MLLYPPCQPTISSCICIEGSSNRIANTQPNLFSNPPKIANKQNCEQTAFLNCSSSENSGPDPAKIAKALLELNGCIFFSIKTSFSWYREVLSFFMVSRSLFWYRGSAFCCSASRSSSSWDQPVRAFLGLHIL